jgi:hypothetical protein
LPLARVVGEVVAIDPSVGMLDTLRDEMSTHGIENIRPVEARWPMADPPVGDVGLIAHVAYDIEAVGPFVQAIEASARRLCVAVLMERQPASVADPFWPIVHGEARVSLPALPEFVELLEVSGRVPTVTTTTREPRRFESREELVGFLRRQLWIADGGEKERRFNAALDELIVESPDGGVTLAGQTASPIGIVSWVPPAGGGPAPGAGP